MYTNLDNVKLIVELLKKNDISNIVISPGGTNIPLIKVIEKDAFFKCYSIVDERSAAYFAIGMYLQIKKPIVLLCTSAQATRNYIPGLTEAFYKKIPIFTISMEKHRRFKYQEYMQAPDQSSLPNDSIKKSFELPYISDINDYLHSMRLINDAILELHKNGMGPVQLCVPWLDFELNEYKPEIRKIERITNLNNIEIDINDKKILLIIGESCFISEEEKVIIDLFCENSNTVVYTNHLSNFKNNYSINANLMLSCLNVEEFLELKPDIIISIGGQTGDYPLYLKLSKNYNCTFEHWRVSDDGDVVDTYDKLTKVFKCDKYNFFKKINSTNGNHSYYKKWKNKNDLMNNKIKVPFSNCSIAQYLHNKIPQNSIIQFSILNSLRVWNLFEIDESISCYSNVGAFGIDGGMSTLIGQSVVSNKLAFMVVGDLAFFYDMNSLGIRHIKNNLRILLINNNGGIEFKLHGGDKKEIDKYIAAANHFKNAEGWAQTCGFKYLNAYNMEEFVNKVEEFVNISDTPIVFEVFVSDEDESTAYNLLLEENRKKTFINSFKSTCKKTLKNVVGEDNFKKIKFKFKRK